MPVHITLIEFLCGFGIDGPMNWSAIDWLPFNVILSVPISIGLMFELSSLKVKVVFFLGHAVELICSLEQSQLLYLFLWYQFG